MKSFLTKIIFLLALAGLLVGGFAFFNRNSKTLASPYQLSPVKQEDETAEMSEWWKSFRDPQSKMPGRC